MLKHILFLSFLVTVGSEDWVSVTPELSNGHLSVFSFKNEVRECTLEKDTKLSFFNSKGQMRALVSLPHAFDAPTARLICSDGNSDLVMDFPVKQGEYEERKLTVDSQYTDKKSKELKARIKKEKKLVDGALANQDQERHWVGPFMVPREDKVTSPFGARRTYNGVQKSVHFGLDIDGQMGDPIVAMADGRVALAVENHFYPGTMVILDHGQGLQSLYMHMSKLEVKTGDMVKRGQLIGLVGKSGRVTGPHLHWGTKIYGNYFYPFDLIRDDIRALIE